MKFARTLEADSIPEWRKAYINYKGLKKRLRAIEKFRKTSPTDESLHIRHIMNAMEDADNEEDRHAHPKATSRTSRRKPNRTQSSVLDDRGLQPRDILASNTTLPRIDSVSRLHSQDDPYEPDLRSLSLLDEARRHATEPEQYFFIRLDEDLEKISKFYNEKEREAEAKYEALKLQVKLVQDFAKQLEHESTSGDGVIHSGERLNPLNWFKRRGSTEEAMTSDGPTLPAPVKYNGDHHMSYNVARNRLKKAITEYYRSLELLRSYRVKSRAFLFTEK
ncbi:SPX domain-containing protein [Mycotypha africana]|uniref:SPX domain-containing protein n=1 Tax=Mycotypha africana TaxID=64632 RepID=UPI002300BB33|nr:SPX domain-containing protein [Mycotypha africana]KAI8982261.1 SPX domain-containing protein [Mycotypha africana]